MPNLYARRHRGGLTGGLILMGLGFLFLLRNLRIIPDLHVYWPVILIIVGLAIILGSLFRGRKSDVTQ